LMVRPVRMTLPYEAVVTIDLRRKSRTAGSLRRTRPSLALDHRGPSLSAPPLTAPNVGTPEEEPRAVEKILLTPEEAAEALNISRTKVFELLHMQTLKSVKIGKSRRIPTEAVREFVACLTGE
jgi:excisionase family DNA binding protein